MAGTSRLSHVGRNQRLPAQRHARARTGTLLYRALLDQLGRDGYHLAIGGIAQPNAASVRLHEKLGFEKVAHFSEVGCKFGRWVDVGYWQLRVDGGS